MDRTAVVLDVAPGILADALQFPMRRHHKDAWPVLYGTKLSASTRSALSHATGIAPRQFDAMHLDAFDGTALNLDGLNPDDEWTLQAIGRRNWALIHASRACPECLCEDDGAWQLVWKLSIVAVCPRHGRLLLDSCPACDKPLRAGTLGRPRPLSRVRSATPTHCGSGSAQNLCTVRLDTEIIGPAVPPWLADLQQRILAVAHGGPARLGGRHLAAPDFFATVRSLAALVRFAATPSQVPAGLSADVYERFTTYLAVDRSRGGGADGYQARPADAAAAAGVLAVLAPALTASTDQQLREALEPLAEAAGRRRQGLGRDPLRAVALPATVRAALAPPLPHARVARGAYKPLIDVITLRAAAIPQLVSAADYAELVAPLLPCTFELTGRRFASLAVARLAGATSWARAGEMTGGDPATARSVAESVVRRIADPAALWRAIHAVAVRLQHADVDYDQRRMALASLTQVDLAALSPQARAAGAPWTEQRRRHAATWVWADLSGGDWRDAPAQHDPMWAATTESRREGFRRFHAAARPALREALRTYGLELCGGTA